MSTEEKTYTLQTLRDGMWIAPLLGALSMLALLAWGVVSSQPMVIVMAVSVILVSVVAWVMARDYLGHQLSNSR